LATLTLIGLGLVSFSVGSLLIITNRFTRVRHFGSVTVVKDKKTGGEYLEGTNGGITKL
jgi:hypothetical protein